MKEIKCPNCGSVFTVDEEGYASIVSQVRNAEFEAELSKRLAELNAQLNLKQQNEAMKAHQDFHSKLSDKNLELERKEAEIAKLKERLNSIAQKTELDMNGKLAQKDKEIAGLKSEIMKGEQRLKVAVLEEKSRIQSDLQQRDKAIVELKAQVDMEKKEAALRESNLRDNYVEQLKQKQELVDYYKDMKLRLSTKMVGETLEEHCSTLFETTLRTLTAGRLKPWDEIHDIHTDSVISLGGTELRICQVPGHTPGSIVILETRENYLFTGDAIGSGCGVWMQIPGSTDLKTYYDSLIHLMHWLVDNGGRMKFFGGHHMQAFESVGQY